MNQIKAGAQFDVLRHAPLDISLGGVAGNGAADGTLGTAFLHVTDQSGALGYDARYTLSSPAGRAPGTAGVLGSTLTQSTHARLLSLFDAPITAELQESTSKNWTSFGGNIVESRQSALSWSPAPVTLELKWNGPEPDAPQGCDLSGSLRYDLASKPRWLSGADAVILSGSRCQAGDATLAEFSGGWTRWGAALRWGTADKRGTTLRLSTLQPQSDTQDLGNSTSTYALDLSHERIAGRWRGRVRVTVRSQAFAAAGAPELPPWSVQTQLQRRVADLGLTAGWEVSPGLVPLANAPAETATLGLDFSDALRQLWMIPQQLNAALNWRWTELPPAAGGNTQSQVHLGISLGW